MSIVLSPDRLSFRQLADRLPRSSRGRKVTTRTLISYALEGRRGVRLEAARGTSPTPAALSASQRRVEAELDRLGL